MATLLTIKKRAEEIKRLYESNPTTHCFNLVVHGEMKVGKTSLLRTARKPVLVHSFDPGGTEVLKDLVDSGECLIDNRFEDEDPYSPKAFRTWEDEFDKLRGENFFQHIGTFALDSLTTFSQVILYEVIRRDIEREKRKGKTPRRSCGGTPFEEDWMPQMTIIENKVRQFLALPCDCILLAHSSQPKNKEGEVTGPLGLLVTGKLRERLPAMFSEIYYMEYNHAKEKRELLTRTKTTRYGEVLAGTRLGKRGLLDTYEPADIKHILKKVGYPTEDKPNLNELFKQLEESK